MENNRDFKYAIQDINSAFFGGRMTYSDLMEWEEVPFKIKAMVNKYLLPTGSLEKSLSEEFLEMDQTSLECQMWKQLKTKVKAGYYVETINRKGETKKKYQTKVYSLEDFLGNHTKEEDGIIVEEIIISKLALFIFSV